MIRKYYIDDDLGGGGDGKPPVPPKGYAVTTPQQRSDWNGFLDYAGKQNANLADPKAQSALLAQYKKANPGSSVTADLIPAIQYEGYQLRKGDSFGKLGAKELGYLRQGMSPEYLNADTSNLSKLYYPQEGSFGTDVENYYNTKFGGGTPNGNAYSNHDTALARVQQLKKIPGNSFLTGRGDALINASFVPSTDKLSFRDAALQATKAQGIDPSMFWASAAEEGATGLIPDKKGNLNTDPDIDLEGKYPVSGFSNFGVDHFHDDFKEMVKRGYLPKDFDYQKSVHTNERGDKVNSGDFKTVADALTAKAAYIRMHRDDLDDWSKKNDVQLSPAARQFFSYMSYNGGPGTAHKLINYYKNNGLLQGDKFLSQKPPHDLDPGDSYGKVIPRWQMAQLMNKEKVFEK